MEKRAGIFDSREMQRREWWTALPKSGEIKLVGWTLVEEVNKLHRHLHHPQFGTYPDRDWKLDPDENITLDLHSR